jgi:hypothetical protein
VARVRRVGTAERLGSFFGCGFEGSLQRVETMPPGDRVIRAVISGGAGFFVDPNQVNSFLAGDIAAGPTWLEFQRPKGPAIAIEALSGR